MSSLLSRIRQSVWRGRRSRADNDATSIGEVGERDPQTCRCCVALCCVVQHEKR